MSSIITKKQYLTTKEKIPSSNYTLFPKIVEYLKSETTGKIMAVEM